MKLPYMQFYVADWMRDTRCLSLAARGAWIDILGVLWNSTTRGKKSLDLEGWASELGKPIDEVDTVFGEFEKRNICTFVRKRNGEILLMSRRQVKDEKVRQQTRKRVGRYRKTHGNGAGNAVVTVETQNQISESESEEEKKKKMSRVLETQDLFAESEEVLRFLNQKTGHEFRARDAQGRPTANLEHIVARLKAGADLETCRTLIVRKVRDWQGDEKMAKFLRPETLFNRTKFESYLAEVTPCGPVQIVKEN